MIKYLKGDKYHSHCNGVERLAVVLITCDPGVQTVWYLLIFNLLQMVLNSYFKLLLNAILEKCVLLCQWNIEVDNKSF